MLEAISREGVAYALIVIIIGSGAAAVWATRGRRRREALRRRGIKTHNL